MGTGSIKPQHAGEYGLIAGDGGNGLGIQIVHHFGDEA